MRILNLALITHGNQLELLAAGARKCSPLTTVPYTSNCLRPSWRVLSEPDAAL